MAQLLTEIFNLKNGKLRKPDGTEFPVTYIDPSTSENPYQYKDEIKKYGAKWLTDLKTWGWFTNNNPEVYNKFIKPCLEYLVSVEKTENDEKRNVIAIINKLIAEINSGNIDSFDSTSSKFDPTVVKNRLNNFKRELVNIVSDEEFKQKMLPIIKFRQAQGHQYSLTNALLILIQDPKATLVKSRRNWMKMNREVLPNSPTIALWIPKGGTALTKQEKEQITTAFLRSRGVASVKELNPGDKEELSVQLKPKGTTFCDLGAYFYDIRFTRQMEGKEDLVGNGHVDLPWYDDKGEETDETAQYCDAIIDVIKDRGIKVSYVADLGGARGVSKSGAIDVLQDAPKNSGLFNTLTHEYAHELLHQTYIQRKDKDYAQYFVGRSQGRAVVEQQAELCAWIVLRNFGFDMPTNINYVGIWGMDEKAAPYVFDTVAQVATKIIEDISKKITTTVTESIGDGSGIITGLDVAKLIGCEELYMQEKKTNEIVEQKRVAFKESFNKIFNNINNHSSKQPFRL